MQVSCKYREYSVEAAVELITHTHLSCQKSIKIRYKYIKIRTQDRKYVHAHERMCLHGTCEVPTGVFLVILL